jgi:hypothetical protein
MNQVLALLACLFAFSAATPASLPTDLRGADLVADEAILQEAYATLHPGLYRYNTVAEMAARFMALRATLNHDQGLGDAFLAFTRFTASLECGHSYPNFYNQPADIARALFQREDRVPFYFRWIDRQMVVTKNLSTDERLTPGTQILTLNGVPVASILDALLPLARADGSNTAKRVDELGVLGSDRYEAFDIYYPLVFPLRGAIYHIEAKAYRGASFASDVPALTYEERIAPIEASLHAATGDMPLWTLQVLDAKTAYLKMPTWETYNSKWDWKANIDAVFSELRVRAIKHLIIDIRGNEGGTEVGDAILAHLTQAPLKRAAFSRLIRYQSVPDTLRPYLDTWDPSFFTLGVGATRVDARYFRLPDDANAVLPDAPYFDGSVAVLVDAADSSATFQFAYDIQRNHLGTLIGSPTGGNLRGINGGAFFFVRLPHSHIEVDLPLIGTFPDQAAPDRGLEPDIRVDQTIESIARGQDLALRAATALP